MNKRLLVVAFGAVGLLLGLLALSVLAGEVQQVKPDDLKGMIEKKQSGFMVVDVQPKGAYELGHIKGAINFPWIPDIKSPGKLPKNKTLILYCDCGHEEDSTDTAKQLVTKFGYTNVKILEGGWSGWQKLGYPIEKSKGK
jgi:rhodanese-related sulfurtransferase